MQRKFYRAALGLILLSAALLPSHQASAQAVNLVLNPSLETASGANPASWVTDLWGTTKATFTYPTGGANTGTRYAKTQITTAGTGDAKWTPLHMNVTPGALYTFSDYYQSTVASKVEIEYLMTNGTYSYVDLAAAPISAAWKQYQTSFTVPAGVKSMTVMHLIEAVGTLSVDDFSLTTGSGGGTTPTPFDFTLASGGNKSVGQGQVQTNLIMATLSAGATQSTTFSASGLPAGVTASFSSPSCSPTCSSTLTLTANASATLGASTVTVTGTSASTTKTTTFTLTVTAPSAAPVLTQVTPVATPTKDTTPNYIFNSTKAGSITYGGDCASTKVSAAAGNNTVTFVALGQGTHSNCTISVKDSTGAVSNTLAIPAFTVDSVRPSVTINQAVGQADPATTSPVLFTAVFSEPVIDFTAAKVKITGTAAGTKTITVTGSGSTYTVAVSGFTGNGTVIAAIPASTVHDAANNVNTAATFTDRTITYSAPVPATVTAVNTSHANGSFKAGEVIDMTVTYSKAVVVGNSPTLALNSGGTALYLSGSGTNTLTFRYIVGASDASADLTYSSTAAIGVGSSTIRDAVGTDANNTLPAITVFQGAHAIVIDTAAPAVTIASFPQVTNANVAATTLSGACETGLSVSLLVGTDSTSAACAASAWTKTLDLSAQANGTITATAAQTDAAGNSTIVSATSTKNTVVIPAIALAPAALASGTTTTAYAAALTASTTAAGPFTWSVSSGALPAGLSLDVAAVGLSTTISGTPTTAGTASFSVTVTNGTSSTTKAYTILVNQAQAAPVTLIANGDFETANGTNTPQDWTASYWGTLTPVFTYPVVGKTGNGAKVQITAYTSGDAKWTFPRVAIATGTVYQYSEDYISDVATNVTIEYLLSDGTLSYQWLASPAAAATWTTLNLPIIPPANATAFTVLHAIQSQGSLTIDNVSLVATLLPPPSANLIQNGNLEIANGTAPLGWSGNYWGTLTPVFTYPVAGNGGGKAAQVQVTKYTSGDAKWSFNHVNVSTNTLYDYTEEYNSNVTTNITIEYKKSDGTFDYEWLANLPATSGWTTYSAQISVPTGIVSFTVLHALTSVGTLTVDNATLTAEPASPFANGMVSFIFDDGLTSQYTKALPIMNAAGFKGGYYIITEQPDSGDNSYMTWTQIKALNAQGMEVGSHTRSHPFLTQLTTAEQQSEIVGSYDDMVAQGLTPTTFVYPYGDVNTTVENLVKSKYVGARGSYFGYNSTRADHYDLHDIRLDSTTQLATAEKYIDQAVADKRWLVFEIHDVVASGGDEYAITPAFFQTIVNYVKASGATVTTIRDGLNQLNP